MRKTMSLVLAMVCTAFCLFLAACGGGSQGDTTTAGNSGQSAALDSAVGKLFVHLDGSLEILPPMSGDKLQHLSDGSNEVNDVSKNTVSKALWKDDITGFSIGKGRELEVEAETEHGQIAFKLRDLPSPTGGIIAFVLDDGRELSINTDPKWLILVADPGMVAERLANGLIRVSPVSPPATSAPTPIPTPTPAPAGAAVLNVTTTDVTYQSRIVGDNVVNLNASNGEAEDMSLNKVASVQWVRATGSRVQASFNPQNQMVVISGLAAVEDGVLVFVRDDGRELTIALTPDKLSRTGIASTITASGFIHFDRSVAPTPSPAPIVTPPVVTPSTSKTAININTVSGQVDITPIISGTKMIGLVNSNPIETVLDSSGNIVQGYRIAWNDGNSWYPAAGKVTPLLLGKTILAGAAMPIGTGAGMPYLIRPDGTFVSFNTGDCTFTVNGTIVSVGIDGLVHY